jgi:hypothetical protein
MSVRMAFLASALGATWMFSGCGSGGGSSGQIEVAPEAKSAAEAVSKNYAEQARQKYANKGARRSP